ncbi:DUF4838 domain-containing protein [bacterium]|nr:DUF4838 domain-containing protein [bacterium]
MLRTNRVVQLGMAIAWSVALARAGGVARADVTLVKDGRAAAAIYVSASVMVTNNPGLPWMKNPERDLETKRQRLRDSVTDLAHYLGKMSGATIEILTNAPAAGDKRVPILIGDLAVKTFGATKKHTRMKQGYRLTVGKKGVGLSGESDESTSFAIYELLERLGCRWYLPSEMGEVIPQRKTIALPVMDVSSAPGTEGRVVWYADDAFKRRTRQGGDPFNGGHTLEINQNYVSNDDLKAHPDWVGTKHGKPLPNRFCWANAGLRDAVAAGVIARLEKDYTPSISIGPEDGIDFCNCAKCRALDAGDLDPSMACVSITDRYMHFANAIAAKVCAKYPDEILAFLAYVQYTRPPVREKLHRNLAPVIAPITYCRAHTMLDTNCPSRQSIRPIIEGWGKAAKNVSYYNYMFHLAEVSVPYPMIAQMSAELPIIYGNGITVWSPETMPSFDSNLPGMVLGIRTSWDPKLKPAAILDEFFEGFYGAAAKPMRQYWQVFDDAWTKVKEHAGCCFGYQQRFTPAVLQAARAAIDAAYAACQTPVERQRVKICDESLKQFTLFMKLREDLAAGRLENLEREGQAWLDKQAALGAEYAPQYSFFAVSWTPKTADGKSVTIAGVYFKIFVHNTYIDASRVARDFTVIGPPVRQWRYQVDKEKKGASLGWDKAAFADDTWSTTDPCLESWFALGLEWYYGPVWYRQQVAVPAVPAGKKVYLWVSSTDGKCRVYVNGQPVSSTNAKGEKVDEPEGFCLPFSFDITAAVKPGAANQVTIVGTRTFLNELGTGGLLGPVVVYHEK